MTKKTTAEDIYYDPRVFDKSTLAEAQEIILTQNGAEDTEARWKKETPWIVDSLQKYFSINSDSVVLDFGCGIGRVAKLLIDTVGCSVIGIDISPNMRTFALEYVASENFEVYSPQEFDLLIHQGLKIDFCYAVWALQHVLNPHQELSRIQAVLKDGGKLFVLNALHRFVPSNVGWVQDEIDLVTLLDQAFAFEREISLTSAPICPSVIEESFCRIYSYSNH